MKTFIAISLFVVSAANAQDATKCKCLEWPFLPDPPCPNVCFRSLTDQKDLDLSKVKNLDPGVAVSIRVLRADKSKIDFANINSKRDLEKLALDSLQSGQVLMMTAPYHKLPAKRDDPAPKGQLAPSGPR